MNGLEDDIIEVLRGGPLSTGALADEVGANRGSVYRTCTRMERDGILTSDLKRSNKRLFYCPLTGEVLTSDNYDEIMELIEHSDDENAVLLPFYPKVRVWRTRKDREN